MRALTSSISVRPTSKVTPLPLLTWAVFLLFLPLPFALSPRMTLTTLGEETLFTWRWPLALLLAGVVSVSLWKRRACLNALLVGAGALSLLAAFAVVRDGTLMAFWGAGWWLAFFAVLGLSACDRLFLIQVCLWLFGAQVVATLGAYFLGYNSFLTPRFGARAGGMIGSPNEIYPWSLIWCGLFWGAAQEVTERRVRMALWAGALGSVAVLMLTFSRAGWIGLALTIPFVAGGVWKSPLRWHRAGVWVLAVALLLGAATVRTHGEVLSPDNDGSTYGRVRIWQTSWSLFREKPLLGHGVGQIARRADLDVDFVEPKNLYAQFALERGLVGLALFGVFAGELWVRTRRVSEETQGDTGARIAARALGFALPALLVAGLFDTPVFGHVERILPTLSFLGLAGLMAGAGVHRRLPAVEAAPKVKHSPEKIAATLERLQEAMAQIGVEYFVIGSCARKAYLGEVGPIADVDIVVFDRRKRRRVREVLARVGQDGVEVDESLSRYFEVRGDSYFLVYGRLRVPVQSRVFEMRRVRWQNVSIPTFPPQTLLHFFNCLVATPLRPKDRPAVWEFARFVRSRREFSHDLLVPFHIFVARAHYLPLRALQIGWRRRLWGLSPRLRRAIAFGYSTWLSRLVRAVFNFFVPLIHLRPPTTRSRRTPSTRRRAGFTLVEILVVVGIVAVLAGLLLPVLSQARERGRRAACASMLADFGRAFHLYAQDYDGRFPNPGGRGMQASASNPAVDVAQNGAAWYSAGQTVNERITDRGGLLPYMERIKKNANNDWACPDAMEAASPYDKPTHAIGQSYTMNDYLREGHPGGAALAEDDPPGAFNPSYHCGVSLSEIGANDGHSASDIILLFEAVQRNSGSVNRNGSPYWSRDWLSRYGQNDLPQGAPEEYHQGLSNFLFCDGHVKALRPVQTWTPKTQSQLETLNPSYARARGGRRGEGTTDNWNPRLKSVNYP